MSTEKILSSDGIPLELSLKKAERKNKLTKQLKEFEDQRIKPKTILNLYSIIIEL